MLTWSNTVRGTLFAILALGTFDSAKAQSCLEQIVALQGAIPQSELNAALSAGPSEPQSVGAQLSHQPTPGSVAAAEGSQPKLSGAMAALNKAQNLQAAGDREGCLKAVEEARKLLGR